MAGNCNSRPAAISSSGTDAPSRKLKADRACSSTYIFLCFVLSSLFFVLTKHKAQSTKYFSRKRLLQTRCRYSIRDKCDKAPVRRAYLVRLRRPTRLEIG